MGAVLDAEAEFFTMTYSPLFALSLESLTAIINTIIRMTSPPDPMRRIFTESNVFRNDDVEIGSIGSIEILFLMNFVLFTLIFFFPSLFHYSHPLIREVDFLQFAGSNGDGVAVDLLRMQ